MISVIFKVNLTFKECMNLLWMLNYKVVFIKLIFIFSL